MKNSLKIYRFLNIFLAFILLILITRVVQLKHDMKKTRMVSETIQNNYGVNYKIIRGKKNKGLLIVVDLLGINLVSSQIVDEDFRDPNYEGHQVILYKLQRPPEGQIETKNFLEIITNNKGILLVDNFCTEQWEKIKLKRIYKRTNLSPGKFCFSEPQTVLVNNLVEQYNINEALVYYDSNAYLELTENFLKYLLESDIGYTLINTANYEE